MDKLWYRSYPEEVPREIDPESYHSLVDIFEEKCALFKDCIAASNMGANLTFAQLEEKSRFFGSFLQNVLNLKKGSRIAIMLPNSLQFYAALFGALRAGLTVVPINPLYTKRELVYQLNDAKADAIIVLENFAHTLEKSLKEVSIENVIITKLGDLCAFPRAQVINFVLKYMKKIIPSYSLPQAIPFKKALKEGAARALRNPGLKGSDIAFIQYTGGTTGISKGAVLTHRNIIANILQCNAWGNHFFELGKEAAVLPLPLYHIFSLICGCFFMMFIGARTFLITDPHDIHSFIKKLKKTKFTIFYSVNSLCNSLLNNKDFAAVDFSHFKTTIVGGMPSAADTAHRWKEVTGVHFTEGYGLTETSPAVSLNLFRGKDYTGGIGFPLPGTDVDIRNEEGKPVGLGETGELYVKGPQVMKTYWNNPEETAIAFTSDGWFKTGDLVKMDRSGMMKYVDRKKDMVIVSGFNVYPAEVEGILLSHPGISEAAVIGVPDAYRGSEAVKAYIVKRDPDLTKEAIIAFCKNELAGYKVPHVIEFRKELPKTPVGKTLHRILRLEAQSEILPWKKAA